MIQQIFKSKNVTITRDMDPFNSDPHTSIFIEEHNTDKKVIIEELIDEIQKPYSYKLDMWMTFIITFNMTIAVLAIYNNHFDWLNLIALILLLPCVYASNLAQKSQYRSKSLVLIYSVLKIDGQI